MTLAELQSTFSQHLLYQSVDLAELEITGPFSAEQLMGLYRNNFYIGLSEYLSDCFPAVVALVGEEFFAQLAKAYIIECPLSQANLELYGQGFAPFIKDCPQAESLEYLADIAALDWAFDRAKSVVSLQDFPFTQLAQVTAQQQQQISFRLQPETLLLCAPYPLLKIWLGAKSGELDALEMKSDERVVMYPNKHSGVLFCNLSSTEYQFLQQVQAHASLQSLSALPDFQDLLKHFISLHIINDFKFEGEA